MSLSHYRVSGCDKERLRDLLVPVLENPGQAGEVHWTGVKVHGWLKEQLELEVGYSTTMRYLHDLDYNLRVPRPWQNARMKKQKRFLRRVARLASRSHNRVMVCRRMRG